MCVCAISRTFQPELNRCADEPERLGSIFTRYVSLPVNCFNKEAGWNLIYEEFDSLI